MTSPYNLSRPGQSLINILLVSPLLQTDSVRKFASQFSLSSPPKSLMYSVRFCIVLLQVAPPKIIISKVCDSALPYSKSTIPSGMPTSAPPPSSICMPDPAPSCIAPASPTRYAYNHHPLRCLYVGSRPLIPPLVSSVSLSFSDGLGSQVRLPVGSLKPKPLRFSIFLCTYLCIFLYSLTRTQESHLLHPPCPFLLQTDSVRKFASQFSLSSH